MKKSLIVLTSCIASAVVLSLSSVAAAQEKPRAVPLQHDGVDGVWLPSDIAKKGLQDVEELRKLRLTISLYEESRTIRQQRIDHLQRSLKLAIEGGDTATKALDRAVRGRRKAEDERDGWLSGKPILWAVIGGLTGIGAVVATSAAL